MVVAVACFSLMDTVLKVLSGHYPALQVAAMRGMVTLSLVFAYLSWRGAWGKVWRLRWPLLLLRGLLSVGMLGMFTYGVRGLPLGERLHYLFRRTADHHHPRRAFSG